MNEQLVELTEGVWVVKAPLRFAGLFEIGTRMTVVRLGDGLVVHSPAEITPETKRAIDALGEVRTIIAPNLFHHMFAGHASAAWPDAKVLAPAALRKKRRDLRIDADLEAGAPPGWGAELTPFAIQGSMLGETVFFHAASHTLISSDLVENFTYVDSAVTRAYLKVGGVYGKPGWHRFLRFLYRDRKAAKASIEAVLELDIHRIVVAHGDLVTARPRETVREALGFLLD